MKGVGSGGVGGGSSLDPTMSDALETSKSIILRFRRMATSPPTLSHFDWDLAVTLSWAKKGPRGFFFAGFLAYYVVDIMLRLAHRKE